jgi:DNA-binding LacI/PurR family transcriptional regulator
MLDQEGLLERQGPRLRTVIFEEGQGRPTWLKRSVAILIPRRLASAPAAPGNRWLQYTTLRTIDHLRDRDIHAITLSLGAIEGEELERLARSSPLGVLIPEVGHDDTDILGMADLFRRSGVPVVCYGGSPALADFDRVMSDHEGGSRALIDAVLSRGCRSVLRFWPRPWNRYWLDARSRSYNEAMEQAGLDVPPVVEFPWTGAPISDRARFDYVVRQVAGFLVEPLRLYRPDALLLATDRDVAYAAAALRLHGLEPGRDVLLAGYDNYAQDCEETVFEPTLPAFTVDKRNDAAGSEMVRLLWERINQLLPPGRQTWLVKQELMTGSPAAAFAPGAYVRSPLL